MGSSGGAFKRGLMELRRKNSQRLPETGVDVPGGRCGWKGRLCRGRDGEELALGLKHLPGDQSWEVEEEVLVPWDRRTM